MRLHDPTFITFEGEPVLGRLPPRVLVNSDDGVLSAGQQRAVVSAYHVFRAGVRVSTAPFTSQTRVLPDGTVIRMVSQADQDAVYITPPPNPPEAAALLYGLNPAFWYNAPGVGDSMPDPVLSGTWVNLPYRDDLKSREKFWKLHPGNRTWRNTRADNTKTKGLVLSWWGLGKDRYTADWLEPSTAPGYAAFPYGKLFCNGELLHDFGSSTKAILGACICEVDSVLTVSVVECDWQTDTYGGKHIRGYGAIGTLLDDGTGAASVQADTLLLRVHHAKLPANFKDGAIQELAFTQIATPAIVRSASAGDPFTRDGDPYAFFSGQKPNIPPTSSIVFNSQGTEGALNIVGRAYSHPSGLEADGTILVWGLRIDPRNGSLGDAITEEVTDVDETHASDPDGFFTDYTGFTCTVQQSKPVYGFDYEDGVGEDPDELVWVAHRAYVVEDDNDGIGGTTRRNFLQHSKYGALLYDSYAFGPPQTTDNAVSDRRWLVTGDLRLALTHLVGRNATDTLVKSFLEADPLADITEATTATPTWEIGGVNIALNTGYEGADSSFDARMIVSCVADQVIVYVDAVDITGDLTDERLQDIRFPVLCGPLRSPAGVFPSPPDAYVAGAP